MTLFEKNLNFLSSQGFRKQVLNQPPDFSSVRLFTGKKGYFTGAKQVGGQEILLHSAYDPLNEAARLIAGKNFPVHRSIFTLGLGLGYHVVELLNQVSPDCLIFVLESDWDIIRAAMQVIDFKDIVGTGRVILAFGTLAEIRRILDDHFISENNLLKLLKIDFLYFAPKQNSEPEDVQAMRQLVLEAFQNHYLAMKDEIGWMLQRLSNTVEHIPYLAQSPFPIQMADNWHKPVVIVLAGPSLNKNIAVLKEWQDRVTIFCVNTVFNKLLDYGIIPDATFSIDIHPSLAEKHYKRNEPIPDSIVLVANPGIDSRCISLFEHNLLILGGGGYFQHELASDIGSDVLQVGLSVTHFAFTMARHMGASSIILIGQDLAYGYEGQTHSLGCNYEEQKTIVSQNDDIVYLEGYHGGEVPSCLTWKLFRDWYEDFLNRYPSLVINATEGGVKIKGTLQLTLKDALENYVGIDTAEKIPFVNWLHSVKQSVPYEEISKRIRSSLVKRITKLQESESACRAAMSVYCNIDHPKIPLELKSRYLLQMETRVRDMMKDRWVFYTFRSEYIRVMSDYFDLDTNNEPPEILIIHKATLLYGMLKKLNSYLSEFRTVIENYIDVHK
jgi:hypothetical protein